MMRAAAQTFSGGFDSLVGAYRIQMADAKSPHVRKCGRPAASTTLAVRAPIGGYQWKGCALP
jgi:hypothetical protein